MAVDGNLVEEVLTGEGEVEKHITAHQEGNPCRPGKGKTL